MGDVNVAFTLPDAESAKNEMLDIGGRLMASRNVGALGAGRHVVHMNERAAFHPGAYWLRLTRHEQVLKTMGVVLR